MQAKRNNRLYTGGGWQEPRLISIPKSTRVPGHALAAVSTIGLGHTRTSVVKDTGYNMFEDPMHCLNHTFVMDLKGAMRNKVVYQSG